MPGINIDNYVSVAERVTQAQAEIRAIAADAPVMLSDTMGYIRITVMLKDERSATGIASFRLDLPGRSAQATNPIEDCETSALGRALAFLGYSSSKGIASREEMQEVRRREAGPASYEPVDTRTPIRPAQTAPQRPALPSTDGAPVCDAHGTPMRPGKNGGWYCARKLDDGSWCKGRPAKSVPAGAPEEEDPLF